MHIYYIFKSKIGPYVCSCGKKAEIIKWESESKLNLTKNTIEPIYLEETVKMCFNCAFEDSKNPLPASNSVSWIGLWTERQII